MFSAAVFAMFSFHLRTPRIPTQKLFVHHWKRLRCRQFGRTLIGVGSNALALSVRFALMFTVPCLPMWAI